MTFEEYYKSLGFLHYPFSVFTSEAETDVFKNIYLRVPMHSVILQGCKSGSCIVIGERGTGKTALNIEIRQILSGPHSLVVTINEYSDLPVDYASDRLYSFILSRLALEFFSRIAESPSVLWSLSKDDRHRLSFFLYHYVGSESKRRLDLKISQLQNGLLKRIFFAVYNKVRFLLNYGMHAAAKLASDALTRHFSALPPFEIQDVEYFKKIDAEIDKDFNKPQREFYYLELLANIIKRTNFKDIYVIFDKIDEDPRFGNDAEKISDYLKGIVSDNKILVSQFFKVFLCVWSTPFNYIREFVRTQKIPLHSLNWGRPDLQNVLNKRLSSYSGGAINSVEKILDSSVSPEIVDQLFNMCNRNPRDLWHILNHAFQEQFKSNHDSKITAEAINRAVDMFVKDFNYYEYYPRKQKSRSNTMDVLKYIKHLQKLDAPKFTKDKLNNMAGTGGSTNNYVVAMENMGLIRNTNEKAQGGAVVYEIVDPKVIYAMQHSINIGD